MVTRVSEQHSITPTPPPLIITAMCQGMATTRTQVVSEMQTTSLVVMLHVASVQSLRNAYAALVAGVSYAGIQWMKRCLQPGCHLITTTYNDCGHLQHAMDTGVCAAKTGDFSEFNLNKAFVTCKRRGWWGPSHTPLACQKTLTSCVSQEQVRTITSL